MKQKWTYLVLCLLCAALLAGCSCSHEWIAADCTTAKTCSKCKETIGEPLGHAWLDATCSSARTCSACGRTEGRPSEHKWMDATCTAPARCSICGETEGIPNGHAWIEATCETPAYCAVCNDVHGTELGHLWILGVNPSGVDVRVCDRCGEYQSASGTWTPLTQCKLVAKSNEDEHLNDVRIGNWNSYAGELPDSIRFCVSNKESFKHTHYCIYNLHKNYSVLSGLIAFSDKSEEFATAQVYIYLDNELAYESGVLSETSGGYSFKLDVEDVEDVRVVCFTQDKAEAYCVVSASVS